MSIGWDLPARWETILFLASATFVAYNIRVCLSVAVLDMKDALNWSDADKAWVLSSFYWGYAIGQLPAGWLTQQYGAKQVLAGSIFFPAILTMLIPVVSEYSYYLLLLVCALRGLFSSGTFPSCYYFFSNWVPKAEKTKLVTTVMGGNYLGSVSALSLSGFLAECNINIFGSYIRGWKVIFYFFGLMGVVWFPIWQAFGYDYPEDHPRCSAEELEIIKSGKKDLLMPTNCQKSSGLYDVVSQRPDGDTMYDIDKDGAHINDADAASAGHPAQEGSGTTIPWDAFVSHPASLVILYTFFTQNWIVNMLLSEIPTYFTEQLGFDSEESGILSIAPYLVQLASVVGFGHFFEYLHIEKGWTTREVCVYGHTVPAHSVCLHCVYIVCVGSSMGPICGIWRSFDWSTDMCLLT